MKREILRNAADIPVMAEAVSNNHATWLIYKALEEFYSRHEQKDLPEHDSLKFAVMESTVGSEPLWLPHDVKRTDHEEREFVRWATTFSENGTALKVDEIIRMLQRDRTFHADIQTLIDLVDAVLEMAGSRVDWDWRPDFSRGDVETHADEDPSDWPEA